jgi:hypothetical protein
MSTSIQCTQAPAAAARHPQRLASATSTARRSGSARCSVRQRRCATARTLARRHQSGYQAEPG